MIDEEFAALRPSAFAIAYRMLGSVSEAEDVVQEGFLGLHRALAGGEQIRSPRAYLSAVVSRLALDHLPRLATALSVTTDELLRAPEAEDPRVTGSSHTHHDITYWPLTRHGPAAGLHAYKIRISPKRRKPPTEFPVHEGRDWMYVLSGQLRLVLGEQDLIVNPGEAVEFSTWTPHWFGVVDGPVEAIGVSFAGPLEDGRIRSLHVPGRDDMPLRDVLPRVAELHDYQYRLIKYYIEHYRIQKYAPNAGYFQFMWIDFCPQSFYGIYDYWGRPKSEGIGGGLRALEESNQPVGIFLEYKDAPLAIHAVNDLPRDLGDCVAEWMVTRGNAAGTGATAVRAVSRSGS